MVSMIILFIIKYDLLRFSASHTFIVYNVNYILSATARPARNASMLAFTIASPLRPKLLRTASSNFSISIPRYLEMSTVLLPITFTFFPFLSTYTTLIPDCLMFSATSAVIFFEIFLHSSGILTPKPTDRPNAICAPSGVLLTVIEKIFSTPSFLLSLKIPFLYESF